MSTRTRKTSARDRRPGSRTRLLRGARAGRGCAPRSCGCGPRRAASRRRSPRTRALPRTWSERRSTSGTRRSACVERRATCGARRGCAGSTPTHRSARFARVAPPREHERRRPRPPRGRPRSARGTRATSPTRTSASRGAGCVAAIAGVTVSSSSWILSALAVPHPRVRRDHHARAGDARPPAEVEVLRARERLRVEAAELGEEVGAHEHHGARDEEHVAHRVVLLLVELAGLDARVRHAEAVDRLPDLEQDLRVVVLDELRADDRGVGPVRLLDQEADRGAGRRRRRRGRTGRRSRPAPTSITSLAARGEPGLAGADGRRPRAGRSPPGRSGPPPIPRRGRGR